MDPRRWMNVKSGRLINNDYVIIFEDDFEWNVFRTEVAGRRRSEFNLYLVARRYFVRSLRLFAVDEHVSCFNQALQSRSAPAIDLSGEICIEARALVGFTHRKAQGVGIGRGIDFRGDIWLANLHQ